jgi:hypothetical protein
MISSQIRAESETATVLQVQCRHKCGTSVETLAKECVIWARIPPLKSRACRIRVTDDCVVREYSPVSFGAMANFTKQSN